MKYLVIMILLISSVSFAADDIRVTPGFESFSLKSRDKSNKGDIELYSPFNPNIKVQYNKRISKSNKITVYSKLQYVNFGASVDKRSIMLGNLFIGQNFFTKTTNYFYYLGGQERYFLYSDSGTLKSDKVILPTLNLGFNRGLFVLDDHVIGLGGKVSYFHSGGRTLKDFKIDNGIELMGSLTFTRVYNKKFFYRIFAEYGFDYQHTSITENQTLKNSFGVDFNFKF